MSDRIGDNTTEPSLPQALREELRAMHQPTRSLSEGIDAHILELAERRWSQLQASPSASTRRTRRRGLGPLRWAMPLAAAGIFAFALLRAPQVHEETMRGDVDGNHRIDIVDAYLLATKIEAGDSLKSNWDTNGDGEVNQMDVRLIATAAVRLQGRARS